MEKKFTAGGVVLNYAEMPSEGAPLVLLHGGSARWQEFKRLMPELAEQWHVFAPDMRGHGASGWTTGNYRLQEFADDLIAFLRQVVDEPAFLFGHSWGGMVMLMVAAQFPEGVRAVIVADSALDREELRKALARDGARLREWQSWSGGQKSIEELIGLLQESPVLSADGKSFVPMREAMGKDWSGWRTFATELYQHDPDILGALLDRYDEIIEGYEMEWLLPAIRCPLLLLQADPAAGGLMTDGEVAKALRLLEKGEHVKMVGVGHGLYHEKREEVAGIVRDFFSDQ